MFTSAPPLVPAIPFLTLLVIFAPLARSSEATAVSTPEVVLRQAWRDTSLSLFQDAARGFEKVDGREATFGRAISLLARQPKTAGNIEAAARALASLVETDARDPIGVMSRYYLGRVEQAHRTPARPAAAAVHFRRLLADHPGEFWAEQAAIKLALIELHEPVSAEERLARLVRHAEFAGAMRHAPARRDMCLLLADVALRFGLGEATALDQLLAADRAGIVRSATQAQVWVQIAELARATGRHDIARRHYENFLAAYERDNRRTMVSERLAALSAAQQEVVGQ